MDYQKYLNELTNCSGTFYSFKQVVEGIGIEIRITSFTGSIVSPYLPVDNTKYSFTLYDQRGRICGVDNHENKPIHLHYYESCSVLPGTQTLASAGSIAFASIFTGTQASNAMHASQ